MYHFVRQFLRRFRRDEGGNVFILFGATAIPLLLVMGGAVDVTRYLRYKAELSNAVDSASLALAREHADYTEEQADTFVTDYVNAFNTGDAQFSVQDFDVVKLDTGFRVTATGAMQTIFLPLGSFVDNGQGINSMPVNITAEVVSGSNRLELALVLDVTGSMNCAATVSGSCSGNWSAPAADSRIVALRSASQTLVNTLMASETNNPDQIKIGVVPFEGTVNIGATYAANPPSWVDWSNTASAYWNGRNFGGYNFTTNATCTIGTAGCSRVGHKWLFDQLTQANSAIKWEGCVEMRNAPYDILDTTPTAGTPDTLFVPFFWPDAPDRYNTSSTAAPYQYTTTINTRYNSNFSSTSGNATSTSSSYNYTYMNNYLQDKVAQAYASTRPATVQTRLEKYKYTSASNKATWQTTPSASNQYTLATSAPFRAGPNHGCPEAIVPLTSTKSTIIDRLDGLVAYAAMGTYIPVGLVWGWHLLTSNEPFTQGNAPGSQYYDTTLKAVVLFTDGENSTTSASNHNNSYFSGYGFLSANRLGTTSSTSTANATLDTKTASLCTNVKQNGTPSDDSDNIRLYVITFGTISSSTQTLMTNCASTDDEGSALYWNAPSTSQLDDIFNEIGEDLSEIHLSM